MGRLVLVVEDDPTVAEVIDRYLSVAGFDVLRTAHGEEALRLAAERQPDLVVLDLMLPGIDGIEVCRRLRAGEADVAVIMLTALGSEDDRVAGLETGADDYVTKPFSPRELVLRVQSVIRRTEQPSPRAGAETVADGSLVVDPAAHRATRDGVELGLTAREYDLLLHLLRHPGTTFSRPELLEQVWGWSFGDQSTVTVHVRRLREKIEVDPTSPQRLQTVWGVGYRWDPAPS